MRCWALSAGFYPSSSPRSLFISAPNYALLPVVSRAGSRKLEAVLSLPDILVAYQKAS